MIVKENDKMVSVHFESIIELMNYVPPSINSSSFNGYIKKKNSRTDQKRGFLGDTEYHDEIVKRALLGDPRIHKEAKKRNSRLKLNGAHTSEQLVPKVKRKFVNSSSGDELDIHKVYQGNSGEAWRKMIREEVDSTHHLVTIFLSIGGSWKIKVDDTIWRCAVILKMVEEIQAAGKSVKVVVGHSFTDVMSGSRKTLTTSITVKKYNETLSPERLAAMSSISFHRVFGFAAQDCQDRKVSYGRGFPHNINLNNMPIHLQEEVEKGHTKPIFLNGITSEYEAIRELSSAFKQMRSFN